MVEGEKKVIYDNWKSTYDRDEERFTKLTKEEKGYNKALSTLKEVLTGGLTCCYQLG